MKELSLKEQGLFVCTMQSLHRYKYWFTLKKKWYKNKLEKQVELKGEEMLS